MSQFTTVFTDVEINKKLITKFYKNGEIELLRNVDFSNFHKNEIQNMADDCYNYMDDVDQTSKKYIAVLECHKLLQEMCQTDFTWKTKNLIISRNCYCMSCLEDFGCSCPNNFCVHKVEDKETKKIFAVYHEELKKVVLEENLNIRHFSS
jgi:hypothetical protein